MFKRLIASLVCLSFSFSNFQYVHAQDFSVNQLPVPGTMIGASAPFAPLALKGLVVNPQKPLEFQFIVDTGRGPQDAASIKEQANQLVKYFLAGLTIPEGDLWVNLSPYEKDRMVPTALGQTDLGRDLLAQDYILKQLTASLIYPEKDLGKEFWSRVYSKAQAQFGTTNVPVNTFNKVWILPDQAQVFENVNAAYVTKSTLKVMLDEDYMALHKHMAIGNGTDSIGSQIVREIVIPEITKEVNAGKNFAPLRQIYQAMILAKWYKETIQNGLLDALYTNKNKVAGVNLDDPAVKEQIYNRYLQAYKKGAFNYIKEDPTPDGQVVPRKYFSGGLNVMPSEVNRKGSPEMISADGAMLGVTVVLAWAGATAVIGVAAWLELRAEHKRQEELRRSLRKDDPEVYDKLELELLRINRIDFFEGLFLKALALKRGGHGFKVEGGYQVNSFNAHESGGNITDERPIFVSSMAEVNRLLKSNTSDKSGYRYVGESARVVSSDAAMFSLGLTLGLTGPSLTLNPIRAGKASQVRAYFAKRLKAEIDGYRARENEFDDYIAKGGKPKIVRDSLLSRRQIYVPGEPPLAPFISITFDRKVIFDGNLMDHDLDEIINNLYRVLLESESAHHNQFRVEMSLEGIGFSITELTLSPVFELQGFPESTNLSGTLRDAIQHELIRRGLTIDNVYNTKLALEGRINMGEHTLTKSEGPIDLNSSSPLLSAPSKNVRHFTLTYQIDRAMVQTPKQVPDMAMTGDDNPEEQLEESTGPEPEMHPTNDDLLKTYNTVWGLLTKRQDPQNAAYFMTDGEAGMFIRFRADVAPFLENQEDKGFALKRWWMQRGRNGGEGLSYRVVSAIVSSPYARQENFKKGPGNYALTDLPTICRRIITRAVEGEGHYGTVGKQGLQGFFDNMLQHINVIPEGQAAISKGWVAQVKAEIKRLNRLNSQKNRNRRQRILVMMSEEEVDEAVRLLDSFIAKEKPTLTERDEHLRSIRSQEGVRQDLQENLKIRSRQFFEFLRDRIGITALAGWSDYIVVRRPVNPRREVTRKRPELQSMAEVFDFLNNGYFIEKISSSGRLIDLGSDVRSMSDQDKGNVLERIKGLELNLSRYVSDRPFDIYFNFDLYGQQVTKAQHQQMDRSDIISLINYVKTAVSSGKNKIKISAEGFNWKIRPTTRNMVIEVLNLFELPKKKLIVPSPGRTDTSYSWGLDIGVEDAAMLNDVLQAPIQDAVMLGKIAKIKIWKLTGQDKKIAAMLRDTDRNVNFAAAQALFDLGNRSRAVLLRLEVRHKLRLAQPPRAKGNILVYENEAYRYALRGNGFKVEFSPEQWHYVEHGNIPDWVVDKQEELYIVELVNQGKQAPVGSVKNDDKAELAAANGGIDLNQINVLRNGRKVNVQFDPVQLNELMQGGFQGFTPVIINMTPISSPFALLGINPPAKEEELLAKV